MKLSEFIEKYGDQKIDEKDLKETLYIKDKAWLPETGEKYYYINPLGMSRSDFFSDSCDYSKSLVEHTRVFQTREEAEFEAERQKFMLYMERAFAKTSDPIDWKNDNQEKWYLDNDATTSHVTPAYCNVIRTQGTLYTTNKYWLRKFIAQHEDDIKRYCFGVGE